MDFFYQRDEKTVLHKKKTKVETVDFDKSNRTFEKTEETYQEGSGGPQTNESRQAYVSGCSHILNSPADHKANCSKCVKSLCKQCANLRCTRCLSIICTDCSRLIQGVPFCRKCRAIVMIQAVSTASLRGINSILSRKLC